MGIQNVRNGKLLYHLTSVNNLDSIFEKGLLPRKYVKNKNINFSDIANPDIIDKREQLYLDKYIPFHFHPYTAFDYAVKYNGNPEDMVYICVDRKFAKNMKFLVLPKHPLSEKSNEFELFTFDKGMEEIDWETMEEKGREDTYAKEVKMAECLSESSIPATSFNCIYVANDKIKEYVTIKLKKYGIVSEPPYINIMPKWFLK
nr:DarT ssDNA thymidine ADP-ribosyltransferase family protein [uncultured Lachnoanaerobaculum sp.]